MHKAIGNGQDPQNQSLIGGGLRFENLFWETKRGQLVKNSSETKSNFWKNFFQQPTKDVCLIAQAAKNDCSILKIKLSPQFLFFLINPLIHHAQIILRHLNK